MTVRSVNSDGYCAPQNSQKESTDEVSTGRLLSKVTAYSEGELTELELITSGKWGDRESCAHFTLKCQRCAQSVVVGVPQSMSHALIEVHCSRTRHPVVIAGETFELWASGK